MKIKISDLIGNLLSFRSLVYFQSLENTEGIEAAKFISKLKPGQKTLNIKFEVEGVEMNMQSFFDLLEKAYYGEVNKAALELIKEKHSQIESKLKKIFEVINDEFENRVKVFGIY